MGTWPAARIPKKPGWPPGLFLYKCLNHAPLPHLDQFKSLQEIIQNIISSSGYPFVQTLPQASWLQHEVQTLVRVWPLGRQHHHLVSAHWASHMAPAAFPHSLQFTQILTVLRGSTPSRPWSPKPSGRLTALPATGPSTRAAIGAQVGSACLLTTRAAGPHAFLDFPKLQVQASTAVPPARLLRQKLLRFSRPTCKNLTNII